MKMEVMEYRRVESWLWKPGEFQQVKELCGAALAINIPQPERGWAHSLSANAVVPLSELGSMLSAISKALAAKTELLTDCLTTNLQTRPELPNDQD